MLLIVACTPEPQLVVRGAGKTIAVWNVENVTPFEDVRPDFGDLLSVRIIETVKETGTYDVVERDRLVLALEELHLGTSSLVDESTRLKLGRLVGAQLMIFGGYQVIANQMRLDLRLVEVETGRVLKASEKTVPAGNISAWLQAAGDAAKELF